MLLLKICVCLLAVPLLRDVEQILSIDFYDFTFLTNILPWGKTPAHFAGVTSNEKVL